MTEENQIKPTRTGTKRVRRNPLDGRPPAGEGRLGRLLSETSYEEIYPGHTTVGPNRPAGEKANEGVRVERPHFSSHRVNAHAGPPRSTTVPTQLVERITVDHRCPECHRHLVFEVGSVLVEASSERKIIPDVQHYACPRCSRQYVFPAILNRLRRSI